MIAHLRGRADALVRVGWTRREAEWLALVCLHSGVFLRSQYLAFIGRTNPALANRFVRRCRKHAVEQPWNGSRLRICRIAARRIYRAIGAERVRHRRPAAPEVVLRRLLSLDYVPEYPHAAWLPTEDEKVNALTAAEIAKELLPRRLYQGAVGAQYRYFPHKLPVALDGGRATFLFVQTDEDETVSAVRTWGSQHSALWAALAAAGRAVEVVVIGRDPVRLAAAERVLDKWAATPHEAVTMGWEVRPLAELMQEFRYGTSRKCYDSAGGDGGVPVLRIPNVLRGRVDWTDLRFTSLRADELKKLNLERGDILFVRTNGNPAYIGRCAVFRERRQAAYASYLIRARLKGDGAVDPEYVSTGLALPTMRQTILRMTRTTVGNYNISIDLLGRIRIPVPQPKLQQKFSEIIARTRETLKTTEASTLVVRHVIIFGYGHGLQRAIIDESQHRTPERLTRIIQCAVTRRYSSAGANPARQLLLQPAAVGADDGGNDIG